ncbi:MAG: hypothetical protein Q9220_000329 [cf. Caloplaca sp. 1 TL-2023]
MDDATAALILVLQSQELEHIRGPVNNENEVELADEDLAFQIYHEELQRTAANLHDHQIAKLFGESPATYDEPLLDQLHNQLSAGASVANDSNSSTFDPISEQPCNNAAGVTYQPEIVDTGRDQSDPLNPNHVPGLDDVQDSLPLALPSPLNAISIPDDALEGESGQSDAIKYGMPKVLEALVKRFIFGVKFSIGGVKGFVPGLKSSVHGMKSSICEVKFSIAGANTSSLESSPQFVEPRALSVESSPTSLESDLQSVEFNASFLDISAFPLEGKCFICGDSLPMSRILRLPCNHDYCDDCITSLFRSAMKDESLFPPRCCRQDVRVTQVQCLFPDDFMLTFKQREIELGTPNPIYCSNKTCSSFIDHSHIEEDIATCPKCESKTCTVCRGIDHQGDCPEDPAVVSLMEVVKKEGYKQCHSCRRLVEITFGCNHMT